MCVCVGAGLVRLEMTAAISKMFPSAEALISQPASKGMQEGSSYCFSEYKIIKILSGSGTECSKSSVNE